jgi:hypothetical protein
MAMSDAALFFIACAIVAAGFAFLYFRKKVAPKFRKPARPQSAFSYDAWVVGPVVRGENRSPRSVKRPCPGALFAVDIPHGQGVGDRVGELSGVTFVHGPLTGKKWIKATFRIEADPGAELRTAQHTGTTSIVAFFQRFGDDWSASGEYEAYRWYATFVPVTPVEVGKRYDLIVPLDGPWTSTMSNEPNPAGFAEAKDHAESVGLVFGGGDGWAHGIYATGPARFILESFEVL